MNQEEYSFHFLTPYWRKPSQAMRTRLQSLIITCRRGTKTFFADIKSPLFQRQAEDLRKKYALRHIQWLKQVHGNKIIAAPSKETSQADGSWTRKRYIACAIRSADCLPIFLCNHSATQVALLHAGWRSLAADIITRALACFPADDEIHASLGPAVSAPHYEVDSVVYQAFTDKRGFTAGRKGHWFADLYQIALHQLEKADIISSPPPSWCTYGQEELFYSHRREPRSTGRIVNLIWLE